MAKKEKEPTFEELYAGLEEHAKKLEEGNLPLADAIDLYEQGVRIADQLRKVIADAELRVEHLRSTLDADRAALHDLEETYDPGPDDEDEDEDDAP